MNELLEFISANFFIIIILIAGLVGFLRDRSNKQEEEQQQRSPQRHYSPDSSGNGQHAPNMQPARDDKPNYNPNTQEEIASRQDSQREALAKRMQIDTANDDQVEEATRDVGDELLKTRQNLETQQQLEIKKQFKKHLTKEGIVNGIVMSEVLGRPRALKPYKSVVQERIDRA